MARIRIHLGHDRTTAHVEVTAGAPAGEAELDAALAAAAVRIGVETDLRARLAAELGRGDFALPRTEIARGQPAEPGRDGSFEPAFEAGILPGRPREDGTLDFLDRDLVKTVKAGERIGSFVPPTAGTPGLRVDGEAVAPAPGRPATLRLGPNVERTDDGEVRARVGGAIVYVAGRSVDVTQHYEHSGDVDLASGHLVMEGSVVVHGGVTPGFRVHATGDVDVRSFSDGGSLRAGGNVRVLGLVRGGAAGEVSAEGDVAARAAESVAVAAGGTITLQDAVQSALAARRIQVTKHVRGGHAQAEHCVIVGEAGSVASAVTILEAGVPRRTADELRRQLACAKAQPKPGDGSARAARARAEAQREAVALRLEQAEAREALLSTAYVEVRGTLYPGAVLRLGALQYQVDWEDRGLRVSVDVGAKRLRIERILG